MKGLRYILIFVSLIASMLLLNYLQKQQTATSQAEFTYDCGSFTAPSHPIPKEFTTKELSVSPGPKTITVISGAPAVSAIPSFLKKRESAALHFPPFENHPAKRSFYSTGNIRI